MNERRNRYKYRYKDIQELKGKRKSKKVIEKITTPTLFNTPLDFSEKQADINTGTLKGIDVKIQCPKCKGTMTRAYKEINLIFFSMSSYVGWLCQNNKCLHFIDRKTVYKDWGNEYKERIDLDIKEK